MPCRHGGDAKVPHPHSCGGCEARACARHRPYGMPYRGGGELARPSRPDARMRAGEGPEGARALAWARPRPGAPAPDRHRETVRFLGICPFGSATSMRCGEESWPPTIRARAASRCCTRRAPRFSGSGPSASFRSACPGRPGSTPANGSTRSSPTPMILYSLYKKHHWLMRGPTFFQLHQLLDKHAARAARAHRQDRRADPDPRRCRGRRPAPGGRADRDPPASRRGRGGPGHALPAAGGARDDPRRRARRRRAHAEKGDDGTSDLLVSDVIRTGEMQVWFLGEHLVDTPIIRV